MRALNQTTALEAREAPIRGVAEYFAMTHAIPINVDKGVGDVAITIKIDGVKLRDALNLILGPNGLEYVDVSGTVLICAKK